MATLRDIADEKEYETLLSSLSPGTLVTIFFHTPWAAPCKQMRTFFETLAAQYKSDKNVFLAIDAEALPEISEAFDVTAVPFFLLSRDGEIIESISGSNSSKVRDAVEKEAGSGGSNGQTKIHPQLAVTPQANNFVAESSTKEQASSTTAHNSAPGANPAAAETSEEELNARLAGLVKAAPVMLFMKGTPSSPQCGFSRQLVSILREHGVRYGFFNILADEEVRQGMKTFADWPTFPQLWVGGELVGGLDIVKDELESNSDFFAEYAVSKASSGGGGGAVAPSQSNAPQTASA